MYLVKKKIFFLIIIILNFGIFKNAKIMKIFFYYLENNLINFKKIA